MTSADEPRAESGAAPGIPSVGWLISSIGQQLSAAFRDALPEGVHPRHYAVLQRLAASSAREDEAVSQRVLAEQLGIPQGRLVSLLNDLEGRGWVERGSVEGDKRAYRLRVTAEGAQAARTLQRLADDYDRSITQELSAADRDRLLGLLRALNIPGKPAAAIW